MLKKTAKRLIYAYQFALDYPLYWRMRIALQYTPHNKWGGVKRLLLMLLCRRMEAKKCSSTGIGLQGNCCIMAEPLILPHGLSGIIIARNVKIGKNVAIYQHVTIAESDKQKMTVIEDNVMIGAGAVILNNAHIGKGAKIGANAVVVADVPAGATAVGVPARIIK